MLQDGICNACYSWSITGESELEIIRCKNCNIYVHRICYGLVGTNEPLVEKTITCEPCQYILKTKGNELNKGRGDKSLNCIICLNTGGILKRVLKPMKFNLYQNFSSESSNTMSPALWIHINCAIYSNEYICINNWKNFSQIEILKPINYFNVETCMYCMKNIGVLYKCQYYECKSVFHLHCLENEVKFNCVLCISKSDNNIREIECNLSFKSLADSNLFKYFYCNKGRYLGGQQFFLCSDHIKTSRDCDNFR